MEQFILIHLQNSHPPIEPHELDMILNGQNLSVPGDADQHYGGTPLHTLVSWCNDVSLVKLLIETGCKRSLTLKDDYGTYPGQDQVENTRYIPPYTIGCQLDRWRYDGSAPLRNINDFKQVCCFVDLLRENILHTDYLSLRQWLHQQYPIAELKEYCPDYTCVCYEI